MDSSLQPTNRSRQRRMPMGAALALAIAAGLGTYAGSHSLLAQDKSVDRQAAVDAEALAHATGLSDAFKAASRLMAPSVVNIRSTQHVKATPSNHSPSQQTPGFPDDEMLRRFFGDGGGGFNFQQAPDQQPRDRVGEGTGVILRENGYIVTNNHVVDGADELLVTLDDDREYPATVVGTDPDTDLAVVKIDAGGLRAAEFGDSDKVEVGEWVIAMGSPFGLQHTVTAGIVSAKGRANMGLATFEDFIQTDAAINPGNSGGPLINLHGEVIGINTAISSRSGSNAGIGFAIPSEMVQSVFENIVDNGSVKRGALGVQLEPLTKDQAEYFGFNDGTNGVLISQVFPGSAADKAGIQIGDIITKIDGKPTTDLNALKTIVAKHAPGDSVELTFFRQGETKTASATLGDRSAQFAKAGQGQQGGSKQKDAQTEGKLGMGVQELTPEIAEQINAGERKGVVISNVEPGGAAASKGLQAGDLITMIGQTPVTSVEEFSASIAKADMSKGVALQVFRGETARLVVLKPATN